MSQMISVAYVFGVCALQGNVSDCKGKTGPSSTSRRKKIDC